MPCRVNYGQPFRFPFECFGRLGATHHPTCTVRGRVQGFRIAFAADHEAGRSHRARHDAQDEGGHHSLALVNPSLAAVPPTILGQPQSQTVIVGSTVFLLVRALGGPPVTWYFGTNAVPGGTNAVLKLTPPDDQFR